ncbi:MAG: YraN family protein [Leptothrix sp. (in: Bacteria)]|nr:YraN family protein [Leptothrix sp. (in: b-proteobacteria)]
MVTRWWGGGGAGQARAPAGAGGSAGQAPGTQAGTQARGDAAESRALAWLLARGLQLVERNYRLARGPSARGGEIDLVMRDGDGTLVFVEVRQRRSAGQGGAAASVTATKRRRLVFAAQHYLLRFAAPPPCRFDVLAIDGDEIDWLQAAFDA